MSGPSSQPLLAMGMVIGPFNFAKRAQVRSTMLQSPSVLHGVVAWRFVVGGELSKDARRRRLEAEVSSSSDVLLLPEVLDGADVAMPCSCTEKVYAWYTHALERWPLARWIGKTEDDTYVNLEQLLFDLRGLARHPMVYYGLMNACGMPPTVAAQRLSSGFGGCFLGDFEEGSGQTALRDWPMSASMSTRRFGGTSACTAGAAAPFATGPLDVQSAEFARALFRDCSYTRSFMAHGRAANRRAERCNRNHELAVHSLASTTCDCVVGHWIGECRLNATLADMSWTKAHHYLHRAGGMGWVAPSNASIAIHYLKKHTGPSGPANTEGGEWLHVHNASAPVSRSAFPPLLYRLEQSPIDRAAQARMAERAAHHEARRRANGSFAAFGTTDASWLAVLRVPPPTLTALQPELHAWYRDTCRSQTIEQLMQAGRRQLQPTKGPQGRRTAVEYFGGNPAAWLHYGCHPSRFYPDAGISWRRHKRVRNGHATSEEVEQGTRSGGRGAARSSARRLTTTIRRAPVVGLGGPVLDRGASWEAFAAWEARSGRKAVDASL